MSLYKLAGKMKFRFKVMNGVAAVEDLWDLSMTSLDELAVSLDREIKATTQESFIKPKDPVSLELQSKFDLVLDIIETRTKEAELVASASVRKMERNKLIQAKTRRQDEELDNLSVEELDTKLAELDEE